MSSAGGVLLMACALSGATVFCADLSVSEVAVRLVEYQTTVQALSCVAYLESDPSRMGSSDSARCLAGSLPLCGVREEHFGKDGHGQVTHALPRGRLTATSSVLVSMSCLLTMLRMGFRCMRWRSRYK